ncbi:MAG TPA: GPP34 family phosphoprotein [Candidatus Krumholzibacteria bacterium]|nr:GPP34 family phosphoprotein [Candidatus Krumholzibacteria bacterium]
MIRPTTLALYEEQLLLALDDRKGTSALGCMHAHAMGGAILAELVLLGAVRIGQDKKKLVDAVPDAHVDDTLLAECLGLITAAKRRRKAVDWVQKFSGLKDLKNRAARGLVLKGVLAEERDRVLGIFPRVVFPERNPGPERALIERLRQAVQSDSDRVDDRTLVTVAIAKAAGLLERAVDKKVLKARKARVKQLAEGQAAGAATAEAIQAVQAAVMVATMAATTAATAATH